jgi:large subunit ribosomal protein L25
MKAVALSAFPRTLARRGGVKKLRSAGRVPAVIYGRHTQPQNLEVQLKEVEDLLHESASETILVDLAVSGEADAKRLALLQDVQHHPLTGKVLHVDFHQVAADEKVTVAIPVEAIGEAAGVKTAGGVLEHVLFKIKLRGLPRDLPEYIEVDVSKLEIGQAIHLGEIPLPKGVEAIGDKGIPVIAVAAPITEAQEAAVLEGATAPLSEAEMLKEKKEGEGEVPAAGAAAKPGEKGAAKPGDKAVAATATAPAAGPAKPGEKGATAKPAEKAAAKPGEKGAERKK